MTQDKVYHLRLSLKYTVNIIYKPRCTKVRTKQTSCRQAHLENLLAFVAHELVLLAVRPQMHVERIGMGEHLRAYHIRLPPKMGA